MLPLTWPTAPARRRSCECGRRRILWRFVELCRAARRPGLEGAESWGKHLWVHFAQHDLVHVHLGLYGRFDVLRDVTRCHHRSARCGSGWCRRTAAAPRRTRTCGVPRIELLTPEQRVALVERLGPDPLRPDADPDLAWHRIRRSRAPIAGLLMDQSVIAGIGNVYRAELLYRHRIDPFRPGTSVRVGRWQAMWEGPRRADGRRRPDRADPHRPPRAPHRRGARRRDRDAGTPTSTAAPASRAGSAAPGCGPGSCRPATCTVSTVPAPIPLAGRTVRRPRPRPTGETPMSTDVRPSRARRRRAPAAAHDAPVRASWRLPGHQGPDRPDPARARRSWSAVFICARRHAVHQPDGAAAARQPAAHAPAPAVVRDLRVRAADDRLSQQVEPTARTFGAVGIQVLMCLIVLAASLRRSRLGVAGAMGESMFVDLRDRILHQGGVPELPARLARRVRAPLGRRYAVRRRLRRRRPRAGPARAGGRRRVRQGRGGRHPGAAALRRVRRAARRAAAPTGSCRPPTTTSSGRTGRRGSPPRSTSPSTSTTAPSRSAPPATRPPRCATPAPAAGAC